MVYTAFCETGEDDVNGSYPTFGIACGQTVMHDVTTSPAQAQELAQRLTKGQVALCHFLCVVEDFLAGDAPFSTAACTPGPAGVR